MAKKLQWQTEKRRVKDMLPFKHNPRRLSDKQRADLVREDGEVVAHGAEKGRAEGLEG